MGIKWTKMEDDVLRSNYPDIGWKVCYIIPGRTKAACQIRASILGISYNNHYKEWTEEEKEIMRSFYPTIGSMVYEMLPNRSIHAIYRYAIDNGLKVSDNRHNRMN